MSSLGNSARQNRSICPALLPTFQDEFIIWYYWSIWYYSPTQLQQEQNNDIKGVPFSGYRQDAINLFPVRWQIIAPAPRDHLQLQRKMFTLLFFSNFFFIGGAQPWLQTPNLIGTAEKMQWEGMRHTHTGRISTNWGAYTAAACERRGENVKALRDLGERIWLHLCPIKQLAGSLGMPNIYLYLVASLHLSAYGFMTSKLFGGGRGGKRRLSTESVTNN